VYHSLLKTENSSYSAISFSVSRDPAQSSSNLLILTFSPFSAEQADDFAMIKLLSCREKKNKKTNKPHTPFSLLRKI